MIQDPADELLAAVRGSGDEPSGAARDRVALVRRRFGLSLPPPFAGPARPGEVTPVRPAVPLDGPAIAAVKWRSFRVAYRGVVPDPFLDDLDVVPAAGYWVGRALLAPSARHGLFVAGRPGEVLGLADVVPARDPDLDRDEVAEVTTLYVDPCAQGRGLGSALLEAAVDQARSSGSAGLRLWAAEANARARRFYEARGWVPDGAAQRVDLADGVHIDEVRYRHTGGS